MLETTLHKQISMIHGTSPKAKHRHDQPSSPSATLFCFHMFLLPKSKCKQCCDAWDVRVCCQNLFPSKISHDGPQNATKLPLYTAHCHCELLWPPNQTAMAPLNSCRPDLGSSILINMGKGEVFKMAQPKYSFMVKKKKYF